MLYLLSLLKQSGSGVPDNYTKTTIEFTNTGKIILVIIFVLMFVLITYFAFKSTGNKNDDDKKDKEWQLKKNLLKNILEFLKF